MESYAVFLLLPLVRSCWEGWLCCSPGKDRLELIRSLQWGSLLFWNGKKLPPKGWVLCDLAPLLHQVPWVLLLPLVDVGAEEKIDLVCESRRCHSPRAFLRCSFILKLIVIENFISHTGSLSACSQLVKE